MINYKVIAGGLVGSGIIAASAIGAVSADASNTNVGTSGIPRTIFKQERLEAASQVLNTSTTNIQSAHKDKTFSQLVSKAGLTKKTYSVKLKSQLTSDLEAKGYSQSQVTIALQHKHIVRLNHKDKSKK
jgi:3-hydroxyacyl-CoA dehydrogenase